MKLKTFTTLLIFALVIGFFTTNLGYESKILLQRIFVQSVEILPENEQYAINEDWILKDRDNVQFNFNQSQGKVKFVYFWASWREMSIADLSGIQKLYDDYHQKIDFYLITNESPSLPEKIQKDRKFHFKITYFIEKKWLPKEAQIPFDADEIPSGYLIDQNGKVVAQAKGNARWNSDKIRNLLDNLLKK